MKNKNNIIKCDKCGSDRKNYIGDIVDTEHKVYSCMMCGHKYKIKIKD